MKHLASRIYLLILVALVTIGFLAGFHIQTLRQQVVSDGQLYAVTRYNPDSFYLNAQGPDGFEFALLSAFADWLQVSLKIRPENSHKQLYEDLTLHLAQVGAAALSPPDYAQKLAYSNPYLEVTRVLVFRNTYPESLEHLTTERIVVQESSPSAQWLAQELPDYKNVLTIPGNSTDILLALDQGEGDVAIMDSLEYDIDAAYFPNVKIAYDLTDPLPIRWAFTHQKDDSLVVAANAFLEQYESSGQLAQLTERYYGALNQFSYVGLQLFQRQMRDQLPKYQDYFIAAAEANNLDWRLLAAIGFQESRWRSRAVSPTGVRGIMMLTRTTAKSVGVTNRIDAEQSIQGGARFFDRLTRVIPEHIPEPDRTWFALAAYNVGSGHLQDARYLTAQMGFNPDSWLDVMNHLPLLSDPKYYNNLTYGKARGTEPVDYVQNIRRYYDLLKWRFPLNDEIPELPADLLVLPPAQNISIPATL
jgi:membrane-bound lytic murein transglycosylase F